MDPSLSGASGAPAASSAPKAYDLGAYPKPKIRSQPVQSPAQTSIPIHMQNAAHTQKNMNLLRPNPGTENLHPSAAGKFSVAGAGEMHTLSDGTQVQRHAAYHEPTKTIVVSHSIPQKGDTKHSQEDVGVQNPTFHGKDRVYHGPHQVYHRGVLREHTNIANGKREGPQYKFHHDGKLLAAKNNRDGFLVGHTDPMKTYETRPRGILHLGDLTLPHHSEYASLKTRQPHPKMSEARAKREAVAKKKETQKRAFRAASKKAHAENPNLKYLKVDKSMSSWDIFKGHGCKGCVKCNGAHEGKPHHHHDEEEKSSYWDIFKSDAPKYIRDWELFRV